MLFMRHASASYRGGGGGGAEILTFFGKGGEPYMGDLVFYGGT